MFDFGLIPFDPRNPLNTFIEEPLKLWEYLSQEVIPLVSPLKGILRYNRDFVYVYYNGKTLYSILKGFWRNPKQYKVKASKGRIHAIKNRTWSSIANEVKELLHNMVN